QRSEGRKSSRAAGRGEDQVLRRNTSGAHARSAVCSVENRFPARRTAGGGGLQEGARVSRNACVGYIACAVAEQDCVAGQRRATGAALRDGNLAGDVRRGEVSSVGR